MYFEIIFVRIRQGFAKGGGVGVGWRSNSSSIAVTDLESGVKRVLINSNQFNSVRLCVIVCMLDLIV